MDNHILTNPTGVDAPTQPSQPSIEPTTSNAPASQALLTPEEIARVKDMLQSPKTLSTGKWMAVVTTINVLVVAYGVFNSSFLTVLYERTLKKQDVLELHVESIKAEKRILEEEKNKLEGEIYYLIEKKELLDKQNISLSEKHTELESARNEMLLRSFVHLVNEHIRILRINAVIPLRAQGDHDKHVQILMRCPIQETLTKDCWSLTIESVESWANNAVTGKKIDILPGIPVTLESVVLDSVKEIDGWDNKSKGFNQEFRTKLADYIQNNQDIFKIPLSFMFTGLNMKLTDANKERKRVVSILKTYTYIGEKKFSSMPNAEVFKLFQYLVYNKP